MKGSDMKKVLAFSLMLIAILCAAACKSEESESITAPATDVSGTQSDEEALTSFDSQEASSSAEDIKASDAEDTPSETPTPTPTPFPELTLYLRDLFAEHGMKCGTAITSTNITFEKSAELIDKQFNSITLGNGMKPDAIINKTESIKAGDIVVKFPMDTVNMLDWAKEHGMALRGHTLIWHEQTPSWIFYEDFDTSKSLVSREVMLSRMESFIRQVFEEIEARGYSDMLYAYDVANECVLETGELRDTKWRQVIGDDYLKYAFTYARKYAPEHVDLYYNDYNEQQKTVAFKNLIETLKDDNGNYLLDGIGLQAHLYTNDSLMLYLVSLDKLAETGLKLQLTELDICLGSYNNYAKASEYNFKLQAKMYMDLIGGIFERVDAGTLNMDAVTIWGVTDGLSWRAGGSPLLFDNNYQPKPSFYGVMQMKDEAGITW